MRLRIAVSLVMVALAGSASAGAWGSGSFENDDALDFTTELAQRPDTALVYETLQRAIRDRAAYLEAPDGSAAIAAAEVVAALKGHPCKGMPVPLEKWIQRQKRPTKEQVALAVTAVRRVRGPKSELSELWADATPTDHHTWERRLDDLIGRLQK